MRQTLQTFYQDLEQYYATGDVDQMERFLLETEAQYRKNTAGEAEIGIAVYNELGSLYRGISRYDASISSFQHARQLVEKEIGTDSVQYATVLNNMAGTCRLWDILMMRSGCFTWRNRSMLMPEKNRATLMRACSIICRWSIESWRTYSQPLIIWKKRWKSYRHARIHNRKLRLL